MSGLLQHSEWPDEHDPHRCGQAPFVPNVDGPRQHSCGSYEAAFGPDGCNKYRPNYPDDLYLEQHGCKGLADCHCGTPPDGDFAGLADCRCGKPANDWWPADGYQAPPATPSCARNLEEGFGPVGSGGVLGLLFSDDTITRIMWLALFLLVVRAW